MVAEATERSRLRELRCTCVERFCFAVVSEDGWVYVRISGKRGHHRAYVFSLRLEGEERPMRVHCPCCHSWKEIRFDRQGSWTIRRFAGPPYRIGCTCEPRGAAIGA